MIRDRKVSGKVFTVFLALLFCAATVGVAGKKHDTAKVVVSNVRALVVNMQLQVGALKRLIDESSPSVEPANVGPGAYATERNGRLTDLRYKARLLESETSRLQLELQTKGAPDVMKLSRALYQETRTLRATIERFPRSPETAVDNVLVTELLKEVARLDEQTRKMLASYQKKS